MPSPCDDPVALSSAVKAAAAALGFDACGIAPVAPVDAVARERYRRWVAQGRHGCLGWAGRLTHLRDDPSTLLEGARSIIVVALNYYPSRERDPSLPHIARYAYCRDYHKVLRGLLRRLAATVEALCGGATRCCVDSAPLRERYWAREAGVGFIGRNNCLIVPGRGSFFVLGEVLTTASLSPDSPCALTCGDCDRCVRQCPTGALTGGGAVDARRCRSCLTIEDHGELTPATARLLGGHLFGCDLCQQCCPHNRHARPATVPDMAPRQAVLDLDARALLAMSKEEFTRRMAGTALMRAGYDTLVRNARAAIDHSILHHTRQ